MKRIFAIILAILMLFSLVACKSANEKALIGVWRLTDSETETDYGLGIEFTKDGKIRYGLTEEVFEGLSEGEDVDDALAGLDMLMKIKYKVISDTEIKITASALFGLAKESETVEYALNGDTLVFDGATYTRAK